MSLAALADLHASPAALAAAFGVAMLAWLLTVEEGDLRRGAAKRDAAN